MRRPANHEPARATDERDEQLELERADLGTALHFLPLRLGTLQVHGSRLGTWQVLLLLSV